MARPLAAKRLTKELLDLRKPGGTPEGCVILQADDLTTWTFSIEVLGESVYKGESFALRFKFSPQCALLRAKPALTISVRTRRAHRRLMAQPDRRARGCVSCVECALQQR